MGILRSKFNVTGVAEATPETEVEAKVETTEKTSSETSNRRPPTTSPAKAAKRKRGRKKRDNNQLTLADLAATSEEIMSDAQADEPTTTETPEPMETPKAVAEAKAMDALDSQLTALAQVRDLIAGPQLNDYDHRISQLENTAREQAALTVQLRETATTLDKHIEALALRCNTESEKRSALSEELQSSVTSLIDELADSQERLRGEIVSQGTVVTGLVQQRYQELHAEMKAGLRELDDDKASRRVIAEMLMSAARSIQGETDEPTDV